MSDTAARNGPEKHNSFAEKAFKCHCREFDYSAAMYMDLRFIRLTSNICENLFSRAGHVPGECRMGLFSLDFEL